VNYSLFWIICHSPATNPYCQRLQVRLHCPDKRIADLFRLPRDCYGLKLHATEVNYHLGETLDAVITQDTIGSPDCVAVEDIKLSDHHLLGWEVSTALSASLMSVHVHGTI